MTAADPFANQPLDGGVDPYDPFGDDEPEAASGGGQANPHSFPSLFGLAEDGGHLVIMEPVMHDPKAEDPYDKAKTREEFGVVLHVLSGPPIEVEIRKKNDATQKWEGTGEYETLGEGASPWPITWHRVTAAQGLLVGQLKQKFDVKTMEPIGTGRWLGRLRLVGTRHSPAQLQSANPNVIDAALKEFRARKAAGKPGVDPKAGIKIMNPTAGEKEFALQLVRDGQITLTS